ncbi:DUF6671 family protein [Metabacillus sp. FJAT-52054]|uniref:DUF6671 family protein n=1 Tax=Metabacillus sediminis TaxID=3117746 RepID=A0ABZ2NKA8_9BACI
MKHPYSGKEAAFATMHRKEEIAVPVFAELQISLRVPQNINTDELGTFTGETERKQPPLETARLKAKLGMKRLGLPYGLASEGSFGPCRFFPFVGEDCEIFLWIDEILGIEIHEQVISTATNFSSATVSSLETAETFLKKADFPSHSLIIRPNQMTEPVFYKGICGRKELDEAIAECTAISKDQLAMIQTDMRAHHNPMRQKVIHEAARKLVKRMGSLCPECGCPGWGVSKTVAGLPCELCHIPTAMVKEEIFSCKACTYSRTEKRSDGKTEAGAMYCVICNP